MNGEHGRNEKLTEIRMEVVVASERLRRGGLTTAAMVGERGRCG